MQAELHSLADFLILNSLKINVKKTKALLFNKEGLHPEIDLTMENELIETVPTFKLLGVTLDIALTFSDHFKTIFDKLMKSSYLIRSLCKTLPSECMRELYYAYYNSHLIYGLVIWFPLLSRRQQDMIFLLQKRIIRSITNSNFRDHCMPLFKKSSIMMLKDVIHFENCKLVYKLNNELSTALIRNLYTMQKHIHNTRGLSVTGVKYKNSIVGRSFLVKLFTDWQNIPQTIKDSSNIQSFGKKLKNQILDSY